MKFKKFSIKKISTRFLLMFVIITTVIFSIFVLVITSLFSDKLTEEINVVASQQLKFAGSLLDSNIKEIRNYHFSLVKNHQVQETMSVLEKTPCAEDFFQLQNTLKKAINDTEKNSLNIRSAFAITKDGTILDALYNTPPYQWLVKDNPEFEKFLNSQLTLRISSPNAFPFRTEETDSLHLNSTITCFGHLYDKDSYRDLGYIAININRGSLFKDLEKLFNETFAQFYVVDENQNVIFSDPLNPTCSPKLEQLLKKNILFSENRLPLITPPTWVIPPL